MLNPKQFMSQRRNAISNLKSAAAEHGRMSGHAQMHGFGSPVSNAAYGSGGTSSRLGSAASAAKKAGISQRRVNRIAGKVSGKENLAARNTYNYNHSTWNPANGKSVSRFGL